MGFEIKEALKAGSLSEIRKEMGSIYLEKVFFQLEISKRSVTRLY